MRRGWRWLFTCGLATASLACGISGSGLAEDDANSHSGDGGSGAGSQSSSSTGDMAAGAGGETSGAGGSMGAGASGAGLPVPQVEWLTWTTQQSRSGGAWGTALTDIANHLPSSYGTTYDDPDLVTFGHETSHGIHAHLRNYENTSGSTANAFYVLGDQAAIVVEPNILKSDMASYVPPSLRAFRYGTYVTGAQSWDDRPLYIWDEWNSYVNGAAVGVNRVEEGMWSEGWRDQSGNFEFVVYAMALAHCVSEQDPTYFASYAQFKEFLMWNTERAMALFDKHQNMTEFTADDVATYYDTFKTAADAAPLRQFIKDTYGDPWAAAILGI